ncbi:ABC transporter permease [Butyricicoccus sp.]|uniref:ABC transporter permease n=1 Tax=Butyricicoccus sp. TaxID=2049021 RepID=UPI003F146822
MEKSKKAAQIWKVLRKQKAALAIVALFIIMPFLSPYFLTSTNLTALMLQVTILMIMAFGVTFCIVSGDCDLSLGTNMCLAGIVAIRLQQYLPLPAILLAVLAVGLLIGAINAFIIVDQGANAFITTLGMMMVLRGVSLVASNGKPVSGSSQMYVYFGNGKFLGVNFITWIAIIMFFVCWWVMTHTQFGRNCFAVGGDKSVAAYSGINVKRHKRITFLISAVCAAFAGFCFSAELNSGSATYGENTALLVNCGVVVGGTPFNGGYGGMVQSLVGIFLLGILENAMSLRNISSYYQQLIRGAVIVFVIAMDCHARKKKREDV